MTHNEQTRLIEAEADKWLTLDRMIFVKCMYLANSVDFSQVIELTDEEKQEIEKANEDINE